MNPALTTKTINSRWFATIVPALLGFGLAALCVRGFKFYGWSLFLGLPIAVCFLSAFCTSLRRVVTFSSAYWCSVASLLLLGCFILLFALDGLICLLLAFPLAMALALIGVYFGRQIGSSCSGGGSSALPLLLVLFFPGLVAFDRITTPTPPLRTVTTGIVIHAPIERVWQTVIAFPEITEPLEGIFRFGVAYPIKARIEGSGIGAIRYCVFSTGSFVEPITAWQEPTLLAFDVSSSPPPMKELSLYQNIEAPHLHGHMTSHHGQFRLVQHGDQVVLEGSTWFTHSLSPQWYWGPISDYMIHRIHERVLKQIKQTAET
ncbi:MAG: hypothetical protein WCI42_03860 [Verrucomicrobiota bacterium]|jgi:hypothetical protein